jgi:hypothetical protein
VKSTKTVTFKVFIGFRNMSSFIKKCPFVVYLAILSSCNKPEDLSTGYTFSHEIDGHVISEIYVPRAFSPNGDGYNDHFSPFLNGGFDQSNYMFKVYSKNELVFESYSPNFAWDGSLKGGIPKISDVFNWTLEATDTTGYRYEVDGSVSLIK